MSILFFVLAVSLFIKLGTVSDTWQGQGQGYRPRETLSFWSVLGRLIGFTFAFTAILLISLTWLISFIGGTHP